ncbi:MAG: hypothetical protein ACTSU5_05390 [Promethearchaeota archaeon]
MAKKETEMVVDILKETLKSPPEVIAVLKDQNPDLDFTKVVQTYVSENDMLDLELAREGKTFYSGKVLWIGNRSDGGRGVEICVKPEKKDFRTIIPTADTAKEVLLDSRKKTKSTIRIETMTPIRCAVCGKGIEIFDEVSACPICSAKAHTNHLVEWVKMKNSCPFCKKPLQVDDAGRIIAA